MAEITRILEAIDEGDPHAAEELLPLVYEELRRLAAQNWFPSLDVRTCVPAVADADGRPEAKKTAEILPVLWHWNQPVFALSYSAPFFCRGQGHVTTGI